MTTEGIDVPAPWWRTRRLLVVGLSAAAVLLAAGAWFALGGRSETFRDAQSLVTRLGELGAPCAEFKALAGDPTEGVCGTSSQLVVVVTDPDRAASHVAEWRNRTSGMDGYAVAAGDGWYVYGRPAYVARVADLLGADLIS